MCGYALEGGGVLFMGTDNMICLNVNFNSALTRDLEGAGV